MQKTENRIPKKGHHVSSLFSAGGDGGPKAFVSLHPFETRPISPVCGNKTVNAYLWVFFLFFLGLDAGVSPAS